MNKCFIFKDEKSQKFWNIETNENQFTVTYGKLGTAGTKQEKAYENPEKCLQEAEKLIKEKMKKGYVESNEEAVKNGKNEAKKYYMQCEDAYDRDPKELVEKILSDKRLPELKYITIGYWGGECDASCQCFIDMFVDNKEKFNHIESIFIGDMDYEENEVSWIVQGNYEKLFAALPALKTLKIKGSQGLSLGKIDHDKLTHLEIICGGLPSSVLHEIAQANLPNLETLVLYLGVQDYGFDGSIKDIDPILTKKLFPKLKHLGIVNSELQDDITKLVIESDILQQLEVLELSNGVLTDIGGQILLEQENKISHLKKLDLTYNFLSSEMIKKLKKIPIEVDASDRQEEDEEDYRCPLLTE